MVKNDETGQHHSTDTPAGSESPAAWVPTRLSDDESRERIREILLNAAAESGTEVDEEKIDAATSSIFDAMKKSFG